MERAYQDRYRAIILMGDSVDGLTCNGCNAHSNNTSTSSYKETRNTWQNDADNKRIFDLKEELQSSIVFNNDEESKLQNYNWWTGRRRSLCVGLGNQE